jgi:hypothetical protein
MTTTVRVIASQTAVSGLPEDDAVNVWHFTSLGTDLLSNCAAIHTALDTFYGSISELYCTNTMTGDFSYKYYDLVDTVPRSVIYTNTSTGLDTTAGDGLPSECAVCLSFEGELGSGLNRARRRGRLYIGPLSNAVASTVTGYVVVASPAVGTIIDAAEVMRASGGLDFVWSVFSPTAAGAQPWSSGALLAATTYVDHGWVDNAFDTQRRRGTAPQARGTFP